MSCSKIFSGDLPELTCEVIKYFQNDFSTLYSCILVNRLWCRLAIPLLWENPFSIPTKNYNFIEIYLIHLNGDFKTKLSEYKINNNLLPSYTLFNYPKFLKYINTYKVITSVALWWFEAFRNSSRPENKYFLRDIDSYSAPKFRELIYISLFKMFIENEANLHTLEIEISNSYYNTYFNNILELILQNPNFIHNIRNSKLYINSYSENTPIKNHISKIIGSHQNLKKILLGHKNLPLYQSLLLSKDSNCSNTLNTIIFYRVNFINILNLNNIFDQLNVLESVHIIYCSSLNTSFTQQIINSTKPFKLKSLFISELLEIESLRSLLLKFGDYLENFGFSSNYNPPLLLEQQLLGLITKYCKNIGFLDLYKIEIQITFLVFIENIRQNLNYLSICYHLSNYNIGYISSYILQNLGQNLPYKLEYLNLALCIKENDFEVFLKSSQDTFFKKLLIDNIGGQDILPCVKEYIMKKKRVNYLAIKDTFTIGYHVKNRDLNSLKDEVMEFKLHDIIIRSHSELSIDINNFIMDNDC